MSNEIAVRVPENLFTNGGALDTGVKQTIRTGFPYVGFRGEKAKSKVDEMNSVGIQPNEFYVGDAAGLLRVKPFVAHLMSYAWFFTQINKDGDITDIRLDINDEQYKSERFRKHLLGLLAVRLPGDTPSYMLATFGQRNAMTQGFERGVQLQAANGAAQNADSWGKRSSNHAKTVDLWPCFRFGLQLWGESKPAGDGDCNVSYAQIVIPGDKEIAVLKRLMTTDYDTHVTPITRHFLARVTAWKTFASLTDEAKNAANLPY